MVNLYGRAQWQRLRKHQLAIEPLCRFCKRLGKIEPATVVDHVVPHVVWDRARSQRKVRSPPKGDVAAV